MLKSPTRTAKSSSEYRSPSKLATSSSWLLYQPGYFIPEMGLSPMRTIWLEVLALESVFVIDALEPSK